MRRLCVAMAAAVAAAGLARGQDDVEKAKAEKAELGARSLLQTCEAYYLNPQSGNQYPAKLADLARPPFGGASFLKNGREDLIDPWGKEYKYKVVELDSGEKRPYVWSERVVGGKTLVSGKKPPEPKKK